MRDELLELRIAGLDLVAGRIGTTGDLEAAAGGNRGIDQLTAQLRGAHCGTQAVDLHKTECHFRIVAARPTQERVVFRCGAAHHDALQRCATLVAAPIHGPHEIAERHRRQQQLERAAAAPRLQYDFLRRAGPLHGARERADAQGNAVDRAEKSVAADRQSKKLGIAITAHAAQLALRRDERDAGDVSHGGRAVGPGGVAFDALRHRGHGCAHPRPRIAGAQLGSDRQPRCRRLYLEQAVRRIEAEDSIQAGALGHAARAHRLAQLHRR